jgi:sulfate adenylyltransferase
VLPRRAEEYVARAALDMTGGLLWQVLETQDGVPLSTRLSCHELLLQNYFHAKQVVLSAGLGVFTEGPRAAILEAIVCQNHGCSHVVLGQGNGTDVRVGFGRFAPGELGIVPLVFEEAGFSSMTNSMVTLASLPAGSGLLTLSEAEIVDKVGRGEAISEEVVRAEVVGVIQKTLDFARGAGFTTR